MQKKVTQDPTKRPPSAKDLRRQDKIRQIVKAATAVFLECGFAGTSMDKIVETAGISKRTLYNYYKSKEEVFIGVMQMQLGSIFEDFSPDHADSAKLTDQLRHVGIELLRISNEPTTLSLFRVTAAEAQRFPKLAHQFFEQSFEIVIDGISAILERENGKTGQKIKDTREAGEYFLDLLTGTAYLRVVFGTTPPMTTRTIESRTKRALNYFFQTY